MKKLSILICVLLCACYRPYSKMNAHQQEEIKQQIGEFKLSNLDDGINDLYSINGQNIDNVLEQLKINERLAIVFFSSSCPYYGERKEKIKNILSENPNTKHLYITSYDWAYYGRYNSYWNNYLNSDIYMIDIDPYGSTKNPHKRQKAFVEEICPQCEEKMGFPTIIVFDNNRRLLFNPSTIDSLEFIQLEEALNVN
jgi:thioredoxin-related protein